RQLPALRRIVDSGGEPAVLLGVADAEPVLGEEDAAADEHPLELRTRTQELLVLVFGAEAHDPLDAGAVVPGSVEKDDLAGSREVLDVALEVPLRPLAFGGSRQRHDPSEARIERLGDPFDRAALAGRVTAFEDDDEFQSLGANPLLPLHQLDVQPGQGLFVILRRHGRATYAGFPFRAGTMRALPADGWKVLSCPSAQRTR